MTVSRLITVSCTVTTRVSGRTLTSVSTRGGSCTYEVSGGVRVTTVSTRPGSWVNVVSGRVTTTESTRSGPGVGTARSTYVIRSTHATAIIARPTAPRS